MNLLDAFDEIFLVAIKGLAALVILACASALVLIVVLIWRALL